MSSPSMPRTGCVPLGRLSPGLVLRGLALEAAIADGLHFWDFLGLADEYKLR